MRCAWCTCTRCGGSWHAVCVVQSVCMCRCVLVKCAFYGCVFDEIVVYVLVSCDVVYDCVVYAWCTWDVW